MFRPVFEAWESPGGRPPSPEPTGRALSPQPGGSPLCAGRPGLRSSHVAPSSGSRSRGLLAPPQPCRKSLNVHFFPNR